MLTFRSAEESVGGNAGLPIAIEARFLRDKAVFTFEAKGQRFTVVTSPGGANRVHRVSVDFPTQRTAAAIADAQGRSWQVTEDALIAAHDSAQRFPRVPARRAFWFGWHAQHPDTMLITR